MALVWGLHEPRLTRQRPCSPNLPAAEMTPSERRALLFLAAVALLGGMVRAARASREAAERPEGTQPALVAQQAASDSAAANSRAGRAAAPAAPAGPVDVDRATAAELDVLPRVGPVLAGRIVADRDSAGPFGSLEGLQRVRGIGPAMAARLAPHVTFSGTPRPSNAAPARPAAPSRTVRGKGGKRLESAPSRQRVRGTSGRRASGTALPTTARPSPSPSWLYQQPPRHCASATC